MTRAMTGAVTMERPDGGEVTGLAGLADRYRAAAPFPHVVLDDVLDDAVVEAAIAELPGLPERAWTNHVHVNERKYANPDPTTWGPTLRAIAEHFMSPEFVRVVETITGIDDLQPDPSFDGGGLHRSITGGHLNIHADFTSHHVHQHWQRRVNLLLYLNPDWSPAWGGDLELWDADVTRCVERIAPIANRLVLFTTTPDAFHGHPTPLATPPGVARTSLALYYFTEVDEPLVRPTTYRARPDDGWRRVLIAADQQALRAYDVVKRRFGLSDQVASRVLGRLDRLRRGDVT